MPIEFVSDCCGCPLDYGYPEEDLCTSCGEECDILTKEECDKNNEFYDENQLEIEFPNNNKGGTGHGDDSYSDADPGL